MSDPSPSLITFLFTDLEGSAKLWELYPEAMKAALARHEEISCDAVESHRGRVVKTMGDGLMASFAEAVDALRAAITIERNARAENWGEIPALKIRAGIQFFEPGAL